MLGLFQVVQSAGTWPGVHSMPNKVMVPRPMEIPLHGRPRLPHASPDGEARPEKRSECGRIPERFVGCKGSWVAGWRGCEVIAAHIGRMGPISPIGIMGNSP